MNTIRLKGILQNIQDSHTINGIEFCKANMLVKRTDNSEDILNIRFKKFSQHYDENQEVTFSGNVRSYSSKLDNGKNKVELYVFTYFDQPDLDENDCEYVNFLEVDGRICKVDELRVNRSKKKSIHLILANNLIVSDGAKKLNSYIPCIAKGEIAEELSKLHVNSKIKINGQLHSRQYRKMLEDGTFEFRIAHEVEITSFEQI